MAPTEFGPDSLPPEHRADQTRTAVLPRTLGYPIGQRAGTRAALHRPRRGAPWRGRGMSGVLGDAPLELGDLRAGVDELVLQADDAGGGVQVQALVEQGPYPGGDGELAA